MGNSESVPIEGSSGFHVLRVQENSPGHLAGLEAYFDFLVAVNSKRLDQDDETFKEILKQNIDRPLELTVYNSKTQTVRQTQIVPSNNWGGQGILGVSIRFCSFEGANQNVWHVISVESNSPAALAGLIGESDYILGAESVLQHADDLISLVQANIGKQVKLYVYNVDSDNVREVTLVPNDTWGGEGCLGCNIGYGYLHRIPVSVDRSRPTQPIPNQQLQQPKPTELPKVPSNVALPGFTGIPQIDQINQPPASNAKSDKHFPDPNEFLVSLPNSQASVPQPADSTANVNNYREPQFPPQQSYPTNGSYVTSASNENNPYNPPTVAAPANTLPIKSEFYATASNETVPSHTVNASSAYGPPQPPVSNYGQWNQPTSQPNVQPPVSVPQQPPHYFIPTPDSPSVQTKAPELPSNFPPQPTSQYENQNVAPSSTAINATTYQPYFAYGAPPPPQVSSYAPFNASAGQPMPPQQFPVPPSSYGQESQPNQMPPMPAASYAPPASSYGQPPASQFNTPPIPAPIFNNLPMPSLSDLGISELIPQPTYSQQPTQQFGLPPPNVPQPQF
ncbi:GRASP55 65 domain containing protein [Aphelenchoides besseyi]|nr:GRASP55 65 domain containing protein [Aphelenchoides besseyi]